jgi:hypothetical protein
VAPEFLGWGVITLKADIYIGDVSLGVLIKEILTGQMEYSIDTCVLIVENVSKNN